MSRRVSQEVDLHASASAAGKSVDCRNNHLGSLSTAIIYFIFDIIIGPTIGGLDRHVCWLLLEGLTNFGLDIVSSGLLSLAVDPKPCECRDKYLLIRWPDHILIPHGFVAFLPA